MKHLITIEECKILGRPIGKVHDDKMEAYITEVEVMTIKPALGDSLYLDIINCEGHNEVYHTLLEGGVYEAEDCCRCSQGARKHMFKGLKSAIAYYVYAQYVMSGDYESTRYGMVIKNGDYSQHISSKERSDCYNGALEVAHAYLKDCIAYCRAKNLVNTSHHGTKYSTGGMTIRKIGK